MDRVLKYVQLALQLAKEKAAREMEQQIQDAHQRLLNADAAAKRVSGTAHIKAMALLDIEIKRLEDIVAKLGDCIPPDVSEKFLEALRQQRLAHVREKHEIEGQPPKHRTPRHI